MRSARRLAALHPATGRRHRRRTRHADLGGRRWWLMLVLMYWLIPNRHHSLLPRAARRGADVRRCCCWCVRIFPLYVALFGGGFSVYAAFGTVLLFMFWLYIVGVILVAGAVLNAFLEDPAGSVEKASVAARAITGRLQAPDAPE